MATLNPLELLMMLKQGNPRMVAEQIIQNNFPNDPSMQNLLNMGQRGDTQGLQQYAQQILGAQGKNLNTEMNNLMNMLRNL